MGETVAVPIPSVIDFTLERNTGAAWGMFGDMTGVLSIVSIAVCVLAVFYMMLTPKLPLVGVIGLSFVVAGGIGNAIDRIAQGYVIDFIKPTFIDFPVFNVADIGVTCGVVLFIVALIVEWARDSKRASGASAAAEDADGLRDPKPASGKNAKSLEGDD